MATIPDWKTNWIDCYRVLEIKRDATKEEIKEAYRNLAKKYHPDCNKEIEDEEKIIEINTAYRILNEEKETYDEAWDAREKQPNENNGNNESTFNVDFEDIKDQYTEEEINHAKRVSLKKIIEDELKKVDIIIDTKSELIFSAYSNKTVRTSYYDSVKELTKIGFEFVNDLQALLEEAYKFDLPEEAELISNAIKFIEGELENVPVSSEDAKLYATKEIYKEQLKIKISEELLANEIILSKLKNILIDAYQRNITHIDYPNIVKTLLWEAKGNSNKLKELNRLAYELNIREEVRNTHYAIVALNGMISRIPEKYDQAVTIGQIEVAKDKVREIINQCTENEKKINLITDSLTIYPNSWRYESLYKYCISTLNVLVKNIEAVKKEYKYLAGVENSRESNIAGLSDEAFKLYNEAEKLHIKATEIYNERQSDVLRGIDGFNRVFSLSKSALASWDKGKALELYNEAEMLINNANVIYDSMYGLKNLCEDLDNKLLNISSLREKLVENDKDRRRTKNAEEQRKNTIQSLEERLRILRDGITLIKEKKKKRVIFSMGLGGTTLGMLAVSLFIDGNKFNLLLYGTTVGLGSLSIATILSTIGLRKRSDNLIYEYTETEQKLKRYVRKKI